MQTVDAGTSNGSSPGTSHMGTSPLVGMSIDEAARALDCSPNTVRRHIKQRRLRAERVARPQGYEWRVYLPAGQVPIDTSQEVPDAADARQVPPVATSQPPMAVTQAEALAQLLAPFLAEIAAARQQVATLAEQVGQVTAERDHERARADELARLLAEAVASPAPQTGSSTDAPRPWWVRLVWWRQ